MVFKEEFHGSELVIIITTTTKGTCMAPIFHTRQGGSPEHFIVKHTHTHQKQLMDGVDRHHPRRITSKHTKFVECGVHTHSHSSTPPKNVWKEWVNMVPEKQYQKIPNSWSVVYGM